MRSMILFFLLFIMMFVFAACHNKKSEESVTKGGMQCGPGKCGASMIDGSAVLVKKKMNILHQLREEDSRRECVLKAENTKALYDCVRVAKTGRLSTKCSSSKAVKKAEVMKCEAGKCGSGM